MTVSTHITEEKGGGHPSMVPANTGRGGWGEENQKRGRGGVAATG